MKDFGEGREMMREKSEEKHVLGRKKHEDMTKKNCRHSPPPKSYEVNAKFFTISPTKLSPITGR